MSGILFDLDGVLYEGNSAIPGAAECIDWFNQNRIPHLFLTNTTSRSRAQLVKKLAGLGIDSSENDFFTPPVAAHQWLLSQHLQRIRLYVPESTSEEFSDFVLCSTGEEVDAVVIGDLGQQWTFKIMNDVFRTLIENPDCRLIALGMTRYWKTDSGLQLDVGPMIKAFEYATSKTAIVTGKPSAEFFQAAITRLGEMPGASLDDNDEIIMIGDDIRGDIEASQRAGLKAIQVKTGKFTEADLTLGVTPDVILDSIQQLADWWQSTMKP